MTEKIPHIVAIIQARMGSTRLPGKVMAEICGRPMLAWVIERVKRSKTLDNICLATTKKLEDKQLIDLATRLRTRTFAGSVDDVLDRFYYAAIEMNADVIIRVTADCPLHDPSVIDRVVKVFLENEYDYVSNTISPTFPNGVDTEVFSMESLSIAWREAKWKSEREHVTPFIKKHQNKFRLFNVEYEKDLSSLRWTVDEPADLDFVRVVSEHFHPEFFGMEEIVELLHDRPELMKINEGFKRDEGYYKSLQEDVIVIP